MRGAICGLAMLAISSLAMAQAPTFSGSWHCDQPSETHVIAVPGEAQHQFSVSQGQCTSTGGNQVAGETLKTDVATNVGESARAFMTNRGYDVITSDSGDKLYVRTEERARMVNGKPENVRGRWQATGGTGKLQAVRMRGTYTVSVNPDGSADVKVSGTQPAPKM